MDIGIVFAIGTIMRIIAFVLMILVNRNRQK